ncbi:MAG: hypothetical protein SCJ97_11350 [Bacillota bacterium]|nr:hypothetical protein [Bacillota bacterium]
MKKLAIVVSIILCLGLAGTAVFALNNEEPAQQQICTQVGDCDGDCEREQVREQVRSCEKEFTQKQERTQSKQSGQ